MLLLIGTFLKLDKTSEIIMIQAIIITESIIMDCILSIINGCFFFYEIYFLELYLSINWYNSPLSNVT